jgi:hypothetical protein
MGLDTNCYCLPSRLITDMIEQSPETTGASGPISHRHAPHDERPITVAREGAIVRDDGFVRQLSVNYTESPIGRDRVVRTTIACDPVETDRLEPPEWLAEARNRTG